MLVERDAVLHAGTITAPHESRRWLPLASQPRALIESRATGRQSVQKNAGRPAPWRLTDWSDIASAQSARLLFNLEFNSPLLERVVELQTAKVSRMTPHVADSADSHEEETPVKHDSLDVAGDVHR